MLLIGCHENDIARRNGSVALLGPGRAVAAKHQDLVFVVVAVVRRVAAGLDLELSHVE